VDFGVCPCPRDTSAFATRPNEASHHFVVFIASHDLEHWNSSFKGFSAGWIAAFSITNHAHKRQTLSTV
jgi:hypothetical protein